MAQGPHTSSNELPSKPQIQVKEHVQTVALLYITVRKVRGDMPNHIAARSEQKQIAEISIRERNDATSSADCNM